MAAELDEVGDDALSGKGQQDEVVATDESLDETSCRPDDCTEIVAVESSVETAKPLSWAERAQKHKSASNSSTQVPEKESEDGQIKRSVSIIDYLTLQAASIARHGSQKQNIDEDLPEELQHFHAVVEPGINNLSRATYARCGIPNDANTCYVNVVVQSLLSSAALIWMIRHCSPNDVARPFCSTLVKLFKEFHTRQLDAHGSATIHVLAMPEVRDIVTRWQRLGAQQDAGEFLLYILNGIHDECKWRVNQPEIVEASAEDDKEDSDWSHLVKNSCRRIESRSAGLQEDSPVARIFGGVMRSFVRTRGAKADSVSLEPFNHLLLDISDKKVDSLLTALAAHCDVENVNDGGATRRLQFQALPKALIICLKRFSYSLDSRGRGKAEKIKKPIKFGEKMKLDPRWLAKDVVPQEYIITAVICHHGDSIHGGHYTAYVRYNSDWYLYDDTVVRKLEAREVAQQQAAAYLLIYQHQGKVDFRP